MNKIVEHYFTDGCGRCPLGGTPDCKVNTWKKELQTLRSIVLDCGLKEESKWGVPCYTFQNKNVLIVSAFNQYCAISFFSGALLQDENKLLSKPGENTQAARLIRFTDFKEIIEIQAVIKSYIYEAIEIEKAGLKFEYKKNFEPIPEEFKKKLDENLELKSAFEKLSPGRQRGYILHFSQPKQAKTRVARIENCVVQILSGKGLND
jgi:uncharacterized protein YdeI (YjbR/CyaY-like superfamily)